MLSHLYDHKLALVSAVYLALVVMACFVGTMFVHDAAYVQNLTGGLHPPFHSGAGWSALLGTDGLGRSQLARLLVGGRTTLLIASGAVLLSASIGPLWDSSPPWAQPSSVSPFCASRISCLVFPRFSWRYSRSNVFKPSIWVLVVVLAMVGWVYTFEWRVLRLLTPKAKHMSVPQE